jgi:hypothetical protein
MEEENNGNDTKGYACGEELLFSSPSEEVQQEG